MTRENGGWSSPPVLLNLASLVLLIIGGYLATQRDDSAQVRDELNDHARRIAILETRQEYLLRERDQMNADRRQRD